MIPKMSKKEPKQLPDLIRAIRLCKTRDEVRKLIKQECALIRASFRLEETQFRRRNILKLMYIHMLGYATHFAQIECLNLLNMDTFLEKRVGYLGLTILLDGNSKVLMMATNVLLGDLSNSNEYIVCLALSSLSTMGTDEVMFRECLEGVGKCMMNDNHIIRKKALVCGLRALQMGMTENASDYFKACAAVITKSNPDHGSLIAAAQLMIDLVKMKNSFRKKCIRDLSSNLVKHLQNLTTSAYELAHDINGVNDPFLQVYILRLLGVLSLARGGEKTSQQLKLTEKLVELLPVVATQVSNDGKNPQLAVQAEISQTILNAQLPSSLVTLALNTMGQWLVSNKNNPNVKYIALKTMQKLVKNTQHIQRHRKTILECLGDEDPSIRYRALDLVKYIADDKTREEVVSTLVTCLQAPEEAFHERVVEEIVKALKRAPDEETITKMIQVLKEVKSVPRPEVIWHVLHRIQNCDLALQTSTVKEMWNYVSADEGKKFVQKQSLMEVILWCFGEYGNILQQHMHDVVDVVAVTLKKSDSESTRSIAIMALAKMWRLWPACRSEITDIIALYTENSVLELQARAVEYGILLSQKYISKVDQVLESMPACDYDDATEVMENEDSKFSDSESSPSEEDAGEESEESSEEKSSTSSEEEKRSKKRKKKKKRKTVETRQQVPVANFVLPGPGGETAAPAGGSGKVDDLLDLLSFGTTVPVVQPLQPATQQVSGTTDDLLADLLGPPSTAAPTQTNLPSPRKVFDKYGLSITFNFHPVPRPSLTRVVAIASNFNSSPIKEYNMQVAVPNYIAMEMKPATGKIVGPNGSETISQRLQLENQAHGSKPLILKIQVTGTMNGHKFTEVEQVNF